MEGWCGGWICITGRKRKGQCCTWQLPRTALSTLNGPGMHLFGTRVGHPGHTSALRDDECPQASWPRRGVAGQFSPLRQEACPQEHPTLALPRLLCTSAYQLLPKKLARPVCCQPGEERRGEECQSLGGRRQDQRDQNTEPKPSPPQ